MRTIHSNLLSKATSTLSLNFSVLFALCRYVLYCLPMKYLAINTAGKWRELFGREEEKESIWKRLKWMMIKEWMVYPDAGDHAVNFEPHDGYAPKSTQKVMKGLLLRTSDGIRCSMAIICDCMEQYLFIWTIFGPSKWLQFVVDCLCGCGVIECDVYLMNCVCACCVVLVREGSGCPNYMWLSSQTIGPCGPLYLATDLTTMYTTYIHFVYIVYIQRVHCLYVRRQCRSRGAIVIAMPGPDFMNRGIYVQSRKFVCIWLPIESWQIILLLFAASLYRQENPLYTMYTKCMYVVYIVVRSVAK